MPKCPKCGEEVLYLVRTVKAREVWIVRLTQGQIEEKLDFYDPEETSFLCPHCDEAIFYHYEDVESFLKGGETK